jgi:hypothetical protein
VPLGSSGEGAAGAALVAAGLDGAGPEDPVEKLQRLVRALKVCGDPACAVRAAELEAEGWTGAGSLPTHSHSGSSGSSSSSGQANAPARVKKGDAVKKGVDFVASFGGGQAGEAAAAAKRSANPVLAMQEGFGAELQFEGQEFDGLKKVGMRTAP